MKKLIIFFLVAVMCLGLVACDDKSASTYSADFAKGDGKLSDSEIESLVVGALYREISNKYDTADAGSCRYDINKTDRSGNDIVVYGSVTLYDKYGQLTTGWRDDSGTSFRSFEIKISSSGSIRSCTIK